MDLGDVPGRLRIAREIVRVDGRVVRGDAGRVLEVDPAVEQPTEVDHDQEDEREHRQDDRELDQALTTAKRTAGTKPSEHDGETPGDMEPPMTIGGCGMSTKGL